MIKIVCRNTGTKEVMLVRPCMTQVTLYILCTVFNVSTKHSRQDNKHHIANIAKLAPKYVVPDPEGLSLKL